MSRHAIIAALLVLGLLFPSSKVVAGPASLSGPTVVLNYFFEISPDSKRVFFESYESSFIYKLYSAPANGGQAIPLDASLDAKRDAHFLSLTPDGNRVIFSLGHRVYRADLDDYGDVLEIFSIPSSGGEAVLLEPFFVGQKIGVSCSIKPDSSRAMIMFRLLGESNVRFYDTPTDGSELPVEVDFFEPAVYSITSYMVTPDRSHFILWATAEGETETHIYSVPWAGGESPVRLDIESSSVRLVENPITPSGHDLSYLSAPDDPGRFNAAYEIFPGKYSLATPSYAPSSAYANNFISPDSNWFVYRTGNDIYSVPVTGGCTPTKLTPAGGAEWVAEIQISPDSSTVVYVARLSNEGTLDIYSVPIAGGTPTKISGELPDNTSVRWYFSISPDSCRIVYALSTGADGNGRIYALYSVPITGGTPVNISEPLPPPSDFRIRSYSISPDSQRVVFYREALEYNDVLGIFSVPTDGGTPIRLDSLPTRTYGANTISPDSRNVVYLSGSNLYRVPICGGPAVRIGCDPTTRGGVMGKDQITSGDWPGFTITDDGRRVVYRVSRVIDGTPEQELYSAPMMPFSLSNLMPLLLGN